MIKKVTIILFFLLVNSFGQVTLRASMGINFLSSPSLRDYLNQFTPSDPLSSFSTAVTFSGEADFRVSENFELGIEAAYLLNSYTFALTDGKYEFAYGTFMPSVVAYYVIDGPGYNFKFGGGAGPRFSSVDETLSFSNSANNYSSTGFGLLLKADGNTALSSNVYANIGADIRYDLNGEPKSGSNKISNIDEAINLNAFSVGVRLGISYIF